MLPPGPRCSSTNISDIDDHFHFNFLQTQNIYQMKYKINSKKSQIYSEKNIITYIILVGFVLLLMLKWIVNVNLYIALFL